MKIKEEILAKQSPSTRRNLMRPEDEDILWQTRPLPDKWLAVEDAQTWEERVGARHITIGEVKIEKDIRLKRGARLAEIWKEPPADSRKDKTNAIDAFMSVFDPNILKKKFKELMAEGKLANSIRMRFKDED